jgi:predicted nucleotidyltransferase
MDWSMARDRLIRLAREVVAGEDQHDGRLAAACVVSSVAADDFTPASDVDILMVAADGKGRSKVWRRLVEGRVFEWVIVAKGDLADVDALLSDAGLTHDLLTAVILRGEGRWLQGIQEGVFSRHRDPASIWLRATNQIDRLRWASERMSRHVA